MSKCYCLKCKGKEKYLPRPKSWNTNTHTMNILFRRMKLWESEKNRVGGRKSIDYFVWRGVMIMMIIMTNQQFNAKRYQRIFFTRIPNKSHVEKLKKNWTTIENRHFFTANHYLLLLFFYNVYVDGDHYFHWYT